MTTQLAIILAATAAIFIGLHLWQKRRPYYRKTMKPWGINWSTGSVELLELK